MVVDSSALVAILLGEAEREAFLAAIRDAPTRLVSTATLVETAVVLMMRRGDQAVDTLAALQTSLDLLPVPLTEPHATLAIEAYRIYGKGRHAAALNLGDCFAYALAKARDLPLLYVGDDFARTDVRSAL